MLKKFPLPLGSLLILIAATLWAIDGLIRRSLFSLPPITIVFYEHLIGLLIFSPFFIKALKGEKITKSDLGWIGLIALFDGLLGTLFFTTALVKVNFISLSVVFLLQKLQPIFAVTSAAVLLKEKITPKYAMWAVLALIAAYFVTFPNGVVNFATGQGTIIAALFAVGAAAAWAVGNTLSRKMLLKKSQNYVLGMRFSMTTVMALIGVVLFGQLASLTQPTVSQFGRFAMIAVSTGMAALYIYYQGLKRTEVKVATILELLFPMLAVFIDIVVYHSVLAPSQYLGAVLLLFAMYRIALLNQSAAVLPEVVD